ncbi:ribulose-phosphate 3-epimerase [candidate division TA06 bacterium]|uniref:Ribulose-phosphate 3-epimerase n=1 Tax=candidate division TA06 bacterium TaxID=2250710 RepID=A0A523UT44_UNCT6|nr:MAG: ribulose-phosphate 3-epimerase [candidate division TA06 bacterium]
MVEIAPSILSADFSNLTEQITVVERAGCDLLHIDVMDGQFVENITFGPLIVDAANRISDLPLDVHLMIVEPERQIEKFIQTGADIISIHVEAVQEPVSVLRDIRRLGALAGVALNPDTEVEGVLTLLGEIDLILVMSVYPGMGGQRFIDSVGQKIETLRKAIDDSNLDVKVEVDGGINPSTVQLVARAGVDIIVAGDAVFRSPDPASAIAELRKLTIL